MGHKPVLRIACSLCVAVLSLPSLAVAAEYPTYPLSDDEQIWRMIAQSHLIVVGTLKLRENKFLAQIKATPSDYVSVPVQITKPLKGNGASKKIEVRFHTSKANISSRLREITYRKESSILMSLVHTGGDYYFSDWEQFSIQPNSHIKMEILRKEIAEQQRILRDWKPNPKLPHYDKVKALIEKMLDKSTQHAAFSELEALGYEAVPAIIDLMDDRRPLGEPHIALKNKAVDAFEEFRQYGPDLVVEALAAVLTQITGEGFSFIYNGAPEEERRASVDGWRIYAAKRAAYLAKRSD